MSAVFLQKGVLNGFSSRVISFKNISAFFSNQNHHDASPSTAGAAHAGFNPSLESAVYHAIFACIVYTPFIFYMYCVNTCVGRRTCLRIKIHCFTPIVLHSIVLHRITHMCRTMQHLPVHLDTWHHTHV